MKLRWPTPLYSIISACATQGRLYHLNNSHHPNDFETIAKPAMYVGLLDLVLCI